MTITTLKCTDDDDDSSRVIRNGGSHHHHFYRRTYAVMVHKLYAERVQDFLYSSGNSQKAWMVHSAAAAAAVPAIAANADSVPIDTDTFQQRKRHQHRNREGGGVVTVLDTPSLTGVSQARRGYVLLLMENLLPSSSIPSADQQQRQQKDEPILLGRLPAMARQNISWVGRITHSATVYTPITNNNTIHTGRTNTITPPTTNNIGALLYQTTLLQSTTTTSNNNNNMRLRVDCHPKELVESICRQLQQAATRSHLQQQQQQQNKRQKTTNDTVGESAAIGASLPPGEDDAEDGGSQNDLDEYPFEGPIAMTLSRSHCTHRLTVIAIPQQQQQQPAVASNNHSQPATTTTEQYTSPQSLDSSPTTTATTYQYYWGLADRETDADAMELKLNHEAAEEIVVVPANAAGQDDTTQTIKQQQQQATGSSCTSTTGSSSCIPLSRAYYKLHQVWHDSLCRETAWRRQCQTTTTNCIGGGAGLDLGAAPGGWTQVMMHHVGLTTVVAVDAGIVAQRALVPFSPKRPSLPSAATIGDNATTVASGTTVTENKTARGVLHLQSSMEAANLTVAQPYSILVCDASMGWSELLELISTKIVTRCTWTLPAVAVITLKMPFKTAGSVKRHIQDMHNTLPGFVRKMEQGMYPHVPQSGNSEDLDTQRIHTRYRLEHLMANADSERTVVAIFESATAIG